MSNTTVTVVTETQELASLKGVWDSLLPKCGEDNSVYLTHEWLSIWWRHFGKGKKLNILLIEKEDQVIGIIPLMKVAYGAALLKFHILETIGSVNCNYVGLILPEYREEAMTAFLAYLEEELAKNRLILRLTFVPQDSRFLDQLLRHTAQLPINMVIQQKEMTVAPYISLPATWDEYFGSLSQKRRWKLRRALKALEPQHTVEFQEYTYDSIEEGLREFFDLHQSRWQSVNVKGGFYNPKMKEFYRDISGEFLKKKWLHFSRLTVDNEVVSAAFNFVYNKKFYGATRARDIRYSKYSVGHLHDMYLIKEAIARKLQEFDFLRGDEPYKFHWTRLARRYMLVTILKKGAFSGLRFKLLNSFLRLNTIRQYSLGEIWSLYLMKRRERKQKGQMGI